MKQPILIFSKDVATIELIREISTSFSEYQFVEGNDTTKIEDYDCVFLEVWQGLTVEEIKNMAKKTSLILGIEKEHSIHLQSQESLISNVVVKPYDKASLYFAFRNQINLLEEKKWFHSLLDDVPFGMIVYNKDDEATIINKKATEYFDVCCDSEDKKTYQIEEDGEQRSIIVNTDHGEKVLSAQWVDMTRETPDGSKVLVLRDATKEQWQQKYVKQMAKTDYLTGLANRRGLSEYYNALPDANMHFMFLDIDNFKRVNDTYDHEMGDKLLIYMSDFIQEMIGKEQFVARVGGDEFFVILNSTFKKEEVITLAQNILENINKGDFRKDVLACISLSIGIVLEHPLSGLDEVLNKCDSAMYQAKKDGKARYVIYNVMEKEIEEQKKIESEMVDALKEHEFKVYIQPKVNMVTSRLYGGEALVRWHHPTDGVRFPDKFIPLFEQNGFIIQLDMYMFEEVCRLKKKWRGQPYDSVKISVNMSRLHLYQNDFIESLQKILDKYDVKPEEMELEITENVFLDDNGELLKKTEQLKQMGFMLSMDDFGSGYSSLNMLKDIPIDVLKIDKGFFSFSQNDVKSKKIVRNIIAMGRDLKLEVVTEGVETREQMDFLVNCGCEIAQGYYYAKPLPLNEYEKFAEEYADDTEDMIRYRFLDDFADDTNEHPGVFHGGQYRFAPGIIQETGSIFFPGGETNENVLELPLAVLHRESYSVSMWVKAESTNPYVCTFFADYINGFSSFMPYAWEGHCDYRIRDYSQNDGWYDASARCLIKGVWTHIVLTYNAKEEISRLYFDGENVAYCEEAPVLHGIKKILVGGDVYQKSFEGMISDLRIYNSVKSSNDVEALYRSYLEDDTFLGVRKNEEEAV